MRRALKLLALLVAGHLPAQATSPKAELLALDRTASELAWGRGIATALDGVLADSAILLWPGAPVLRGKRQIDRFFAAQPSSLAAARFLWSPLHVEGADQGGLALVWGAITVDRAATANVPAIRRIGRYLAVWQRAGAGPWRLVAFAPNGLLPAAETAWHDSLGPRELPALLAASRSGLAVPGRIFAVADSSFAADAAHNHAAAAFTKWAAPDAITFSGSGELNIGPASIHASIAGVGNAEWKWAPVAAGMSTGTTTILGYTIGQATITTKDESSRSKYLTMWRRLPGGKPKFVADGGSARP